MSAGVGTPGRDAAFPGRAAERVRRSGLRVSGGVGAARRVELALCALALSGLLLFEPLELAWSWAGPVLALHVIGGALLVGFVVTPFLIRHRQRLRTSYQPVMRWSGRLNELLLVGLGGSGFYLFLAGNPGGLPGRVAEQLHLWLTLPLLGLLWFHMGRGSGPGRLWSWVRAARHRPPSD